MPTTAPAVTIIPAPAGIEDELFVHSISGALLTTRIIGFRVTDSGAEAIIYPRVTGEQWAKVEDLGGGYVGAFGRKGLNPTDLSNAIRNRRPTE